MKFAQNAGVGLYSKVGLHSRQYGIRRYNNNKVKGPCIALHANLIYKSNPHKVLKDRGINFGLKISHTVLKIGNMH